MLHVSFSSLLAEDWELPDNRIDENNLYDGKEQLIDERQLFYTNINKQKKEWMTLLTYIIHYFPIRIMNNRKIG